MSRLLPRHQNLPHHRLPAQCPSRSQWPSTTDCVFWQSWTRLATFLMFKTLVVSCQAVSTRAHSIISPSPHLFATTDHSHSIYLIIHICTVLSLTLFRFPASRPANKSFVHVCSLLFFHIRAPANLRSGMQILIDPYRKDHRP